MNILIYTDGKPAAVAALHMGSTLHDRLGGEIVFITTRPGSHATEDNIKPTNSLERISGDFMGVYLWRVRSNL